MSLRVQIIFLFVLFLAWDGVSQTTITYQCILRSNNQKDTMCDGTVLPIFGITSSLGATSKIPAKILYCTEGDSVVLNTKSISQGEHHTIHLHGLDVDTRNDGDPSTSFWLDHMEDTTYSFNATNAGTYIYHCHAADVVHVQMGMYGLIVVKAAGGVKAAWTGGPLYDKDYKWLMSEVDSAWHNNVPVHDTLMDTVRIPKYVPNYFLINGKCANEISTDDSIQIKGAQGEKIFMRLANIGYLTNRVVFPSWLGAQIIDSDGRPLPNMIVNDTCYIMPGERFGVMLQPGTQATANVPVDFLDMNTGASVYSQNVPVTISGMIGVVENTMVQEAMFYPNPVTSYLFSKQDLPAGTEIQIINTLGQVMQHGAFSKELNISSLPAGVYFTRILIGDLPVRMSKFVKE